MTRSTDLLDLLAQDAWARRLARSLASGPEDAEDLVQEAYARALTSGATPVAHARGWFARVLRNVDIKRRHADSARALRERAHARIRASVSAHTSPRDAVDEPRDDEPSPDELAARAEVQERLAAAVLALEPRQRDVVLLRHFDDASVAAIARRLGLAPATVHEHLERGHAELRRKLASWASDTRFSGGFALLLVGRDAAPAAAVGIGGGAAAALHPTPLFLLLMTISKLSIGVALAAALSLFLWRTLDDAPGRSERAPDQSVPLVRATRATEAAAVEEPTPAPGDEATRVAAATVAPDAGAPAAGTATLRVKVVDERGVGVAGARAWVESGTLQDAPSDGIVIVRRRGTSAPSLFGDTDADGVVSIYVEANKPMTLAALETWTSSRETLAVAPLEPGALVDVTIALRTIADTELALRVVDAETEEPIANARLYLEMSRGQGSGEELRTLPPSRSEPAVTDEHGLVHVRVKSWMRAWCTVLAPGHGPWVQLLRKPGDASLADREPIVVTLPRSARIEGVVTGAGTDAEVRAQFTHKAIEPKLVIRDIADFVGASRYELRTPVTASGDFILADVPADTAVTLALHVQGAGEARLKSPEPLQTVAGEVHRVSWDLTAARRFVCTVREVDGTPVRGQSVVLYTHGDSRVGATDPKRDPTKSTLTDDAGVAVLDGVEPGPWLIGLASPQQRGKSVRLPPERAFAAYTIAVEMPEAEGDVPVDLTLHRGLYIEGRVVGPDGGTPTLVVHAASEHFHALAEFREVVDGKFRLGPLVPGLYTVGAYPFVAIGAAASYAPPNPVQVQAGAVDVELVLRAGGTVSLRAVDAVTREAVDAQFRLARIGSAGYHGSGNGARAQFEANGLEPGAYLALALAPDERVGLLQGFDVGTTEPSEVTVVIAPGGTLVVRGSEHGHPRDVHVMSGDCVIDHQALERGAEVRSILPPGHYRVEIVSRDRGAVLTQRDERFDAVHEVELRVGEETILDLTP